MSTPRSAGGQPYRTKGRPLAGALASLTGTLLAAQKFAESEPSARECLGIREKKLPELPGDW